MSWDVLFWCLEMADFPNGINILIDTLIFPEDVKSSTDNSEFHTLLRMIVSLNTRSKAKFK